MMIIHRQARNEELGAEKPSGLMRSKVTGGEWPPGACVLSRAAMMGPMISCLVTYITIIGDK